MYSFNFASDLISKYPTHSVLIFWSSAVFLALIGYFIGSLNGGIVLSRIVFKDDIRSHGSGNAGATNMLRTHGTVFGVVTLLFDFFKTFVSVFAGALLMNILGAYIAGFFCVMGHIFPIYYGFKGGKGVAAAGAMIAFTDIRVFVILVIIFLIVVIGTKYVSLGSVIVAAVYPLLLSKFVTSSETSTSFHYIGVLFSFIIGITVIVKHRENIKRIYNHTESKFTFKKDGKKDEKNV